MDSSKLRKFVLRSTSAVSLNERFSQVLVDQLTQSRTVTLDTIMVPSSPPVVLVVNKGASLLPRLQVAGFSARVKQRRRSIWTRLGWQKVSQHPRTPKPRGFWSFRNKYKWRFRFRSTCRRCSNLHIQLGQHRPMTKTNIRNPTAGKKPTQHLQTDAAPASKGRGQRKHGALTRKRLDAQLDEYMSKSKSRLDQQLEDHMSMSRQRLDAELDEYMLMAGKAELHWD
ncbi:uncharacterized protein LOC114842820 [Betta splendens]|uniref:Uncharacterized protein LOC114842820 n=1 Tax=Betta splendens TaxID=158456 RepID=A0A6P7KQ22_BETSP|nr:uncharacterized protein LOC114842820 [Betta splendens]XP_028984576.1 uncharacterized protein LOC114842820 [Betta splendens]XP_028984577.1 uncharacterized protein LOC114842820 [Betta splendens]XP_040923636.1 uncharacterized protein LOC114842820 [Betta splendens]